MNTRSRTPRCRRLGLSVGVLILGGACADPTLGIEIEGQRVPVIDMHIHTGEWGSIPESARELIAGNLPFPFNTDPEGVAERVLSADGIADELDAAGISRAGLLAVYAPRSTGVASNEFVAQTVAERPDRFHGLASLRVEDWGTEEAAQLAQLEEALDRPEMIGIKLAHAHQHFRMDDPAYFSIYEVAERRGAPMYLHTGTSPFPGTTAEAPYTDPAYLEDAIAAHPGAIFILGHLGHDIEDTELRATDRCIDLAQHYDNVYLEASVIGSESSDPTGDKLAEAMKRIRDAGLVDRVVYGSDGAQSPGFVGRYVEGTVEAMQRSGYTVDEMSMVLSGNFVRVFGVQAPTL